MAGSLWAWYCREGSIHTANRPGGCFFSVQPHSTNFLWPILFFAWIDEAFGLHVQGQGPDVLGAKIQGMGKICIFIPTLLVHFFWCCLKNLICPFHCPLRSKGGLKCAPLLMAGMNYTWFSHGLSLADGTQIALCCTSYGLRGAGQKVLLFTANISERNQCANTDSYPDVWCYAASEDISLALAPYISIKYPHQDWEGEWVCCDRFNLFQVCTYFFQLHW